MRPRVGVALLLLAARAAEAGHSACATQRDLARGLLALHRQGRAAGLLSAIAAGARDDLDQAQVALLEDRGDLVARSNPFDLDGASLRLSPASGGAYALARLALPLPAAGSSLALGADEARAVELPFAFSFYSKNYMWTFVHSDGHLSFGAPDAAPGERGLGRFLAGPPRIAPFFADLDPARSGSVSTRLLPDRAEFVWSEVAGAAQANRNSFAVTLHPDGAIEMAWGRMQTREAVVGICPGATRQLTAVDLSAASPASGAGALAERFSETEHVDLAGVAQRFYAGHPDLFDQLVVYTTRPLNPVGGTLAFEVTLRNDVRGVGLPLFDDAAQWGSAGRLSSLVYMDAIDPYLEVDGFEILGQEVGHRWLAYLSFRDPLGEASAGLLGRGEAHWSFFFDSDASAMEGNEIAELGGGRFETVDFARRYSPLDQYAMGLRAPEEVPPFFYVADPDDFRPDRSYTSASAPEAGVSFTGVKREVRIEDVIAAMGPRVPDAAHSSRVLRQAFILVFDAKAPATPERRAAVARIRARFEAFFREATEGRGQADSSLP